MHPDAAGVDIGAEEIFVAVPIDRDAEPVRSFGTFTRDLFELADWLQRCRVRTVARRSHWLPANPPGTMHADVNAGSKPIEVMVVELQNDKYALCTRSPVS